MRCTMIHWPVDRESMLFQASPRDTCREGRTREGEGELQEKKKREFAGNTRNAVEKPSTLPPLVLVVYNRKWWRPVITRQRAFRENIYEHRYGTSIFSFCLYIIYHIAHQQRAETTLAFFLAEDTWAKI